MRALLLCLCAVPALAGEWAILSNGFRVHADRHEKHGEMIRLETQAGSMELPSSAVASFEAEEYTLPPDKESAKTPALVIAPAPEQNLPVRSPQELVEAAAHKAELPPAIVHAVARAESGYRQNAISRKGAIGVMQLMPGTAKELRADPYDAEQNTEAGARYLRDLLIKYQGDVPKALAAYNAGPGAVDRYGAVPPYPETRSYVNRVISNYRKLGGE